MAMDSISASSIVFLASVALCALFSFLETSITALRLFKLKELAEQSKSYRHIFYSLEHTPNELLNAILVANSLANTTGATAGTVLSDWLFGALPPSLGLPLSILCVTAVLLVCGEIIPKNIAKIHGERLLPSTLWLTNIVFVTLRPVVALLVRGTDRLMVLLTGMKPEQTDYVTSEKEIRFLIDYIDDHNLMDRDKTAMLQSIFTLSATRVKEVMRPFPSVVCLDVNASWQEAYDTFAHHHYSRIPVYEGESSHIIGLIYVKDMIFRHIRDDSPKALRELVRPIIFIPENVRINHALKAFRENHMHIAMVTNEHGSTTGLIALEDILEEIVGDIHDEYEQAHQSLQHIAPDRWLVWGDTSLDLIERNLGIPFSVHETHTIAGFLTEQFQRLPQVGTKLIYQNYTFTVHDADNKRIKRVIITKSPDTSEKGAA